MENKKVIITGASHGIGKGIAKEFASLGYDVAFSYNSGEAAAQELCSQLQQEYGIRCFCYQASMEKPGVGVDFFHKAVQALGGVDVLVNNAGVTRFENLLDLTEEKVELLINLDLKNYIYMMQAGARYMVDHGIRGSIVNITSSRGEQAYPGDGIYGGCKAALNRAIESFALDVAPYGVRINNVAPGSIQVRTAGDLAGRDPFILEVYAQLGKKIPLARMGTPGDIAKAVAYLASDAASYITGVTLRVDGGLVLPGMPERPDPSGADHGWGFFRREN